MSKKQKPALEESDSEISNLNEPDDEWEDEDIKSVPSKQSKRGRKRLPEMWSRVINLSKDDLTNLKVYELAPDLLMSNGMKHTLSRGKHSKDWKPLFWPDDYAK